MVGHSETRHLRSSSLIAAAYFASTTGCIATKRVPTARMT